jgi:hypothetical protein
MPGAFCLCWLVFWGISRDVVYALIAAGMVAGSVTLTFAVVARTVWTPRPVTVSRMRLVLAFFGLQVGLTGALLLVAFGVPVPRAATAGAALGAAAGAAYSRTRVTEQLRGLPPRERRATKWCLARFHGNLAVSGTMRTT